MELRHGVEIVNPEGLHARPCHAIVATALSYQSDLRVWMGGRSVNGKSIIELMTLEAGCGSKLELVANGGDAQAMIDALVALFGRGFGEA